MNSSSRELWRSVEPFHQVAYRSPEASDIYTNLGLTRPEDQYFANRLCALGTVGPTTAAAVLFGFNPEYVSASVPAIWSIVDPRVVVAARIEVASSTLRRVLQGVDHSQLRIASGLASSLVDGLDYALAPMAAAWADVDRPDDSLVSLWLSCTVLREHRGDAHWRATAVAGVDPVECHLLHAADGAMPAELLQRVSRWNDHDWSTARIRLIERGLLSPGAELHLTDHGREVKTAIERETDRHLPDECASDATSLRTIMKPWTDTITESGAVGAWKMREELWRNDA